jgi:hypothetical protein
MEAKEVEIGLVIGFESPPAVLAARHNIALEPTAQVNLSAATQRER